MKLRPWFLATLAISACSFGAARTDSRSWLRAVPRDEMRELSTDRPDMTESPYTVDAGHVQVEVDLFSLSRDDESGFRTERLGVAATNLKLGITPRIDAQLIAPLYVRDRLTGPFPGSPTDRSGIGDLMLRAKINLWGDDGGTSAFAVMPFTELPTGRDELGGGSAIAWGSSAQLALGLPHGFDLGSMLELETEDGASLWLATLTVGHDLIGPLGGYLEVSAARPSTGDRELLQTFNSGLTWAVTPDVQLDAGTVVGTTRGADDFVGFLGITLRR